MMVWETSSHSIHYRHILHILLHIPLYLFSCVPPSKFFFFSNSHLVINFTFPSSTHCRIFYSSPLIQFLKILLFFLLLIWLNHQRTLSLILSFTLSVTAHSSLTHAFSTKYILITPNKPLRLSICTALGRNLSFSLHAIGLLSYIKIVTSRSPYSSRSHSSRESQT